MTQENENNIDKLKKEYSKIQKEYNLPSFEQLNEDFQIEKIEIDTEHLIREIRKFIADKFANYLRLIETILHPTNAPMFIFSVIKTLGIEEKNILTELYKKLAKNEVNLIELDIIFNEEKEAEFIKESFEIWQDMKKDLIQVISVIQKNWDNKSENNGKNYFG